MRALDPDCADNVICPWCEHEYFGADGVGFDGEGEYVCDECEEPFRLELYITYSTSKVQA